MAAFLPAYRGICAVERWGRNLERARSLSGAGDLGAGHFTALHRGWGCAGRHGGGWGLPLGRRRAPLTPWNFGLLDLNVICLAISPNFNDDETLLAGTDSGLFRSTNGAAWREVDLRVGFDPVLSLAFSPGFAQDGQAWAGTETKGLLATSDGGESWSRLAEAEITEPVNAVLVSPEPADPPELLVLHDDRLLVSNDGGQSWSRWREDPALEEGAAAVLAPLGFANGTPALVALADGRIMTIS
jgi:hypothetical protein